MSANDIDPRSGRAKALQTEFPVTNPGRDGSTSTQGVPAAVDKSKFHRNDGVVKVRSLASEETNTNLRREFHADGSPVHRAFPNQQATNELTAQLLGEAVMSGGTLPGVTQEQIAAPLPVRTPE